jgi:hypothetical protein
MREIVGCCGGEWTAHGRTKSNNDVCEVQSSDVLIIF